MKGEQTFVATIMAAKGHDLSETFREATRAHLSSEGFSDPNPTWLASQRALDIFVTAKGEEPLRKALQGLLGDSPVDCVVQTAANRQKKLVICDMESTIIEQEMLDELASEMGLGDKIAEITRRTMNGEIDFPAALKQRIAMMKGRPAELLDRVRAKITLMPGAEELCRTMKKTGAVLWLVSGGLTVFAEPVAKRLGFDAVYANRIAVKDGVLTGAVEDPILDRGSKKTLLEKAAGGLKLKLSDALAIGDGANDIPMLEACHKAGGLGLAFHAKPAVRAVIPNQLNVTELTGALYAQGLSVRN